MLHGNYESRSIQVKDTSNVSYIVSMRYDTQIWVKYGQTQMLG